MATIERTTWTDIAANLAPVFKGDRESIHTMVESGTAECFTVKPGPCDFIAREDEQADGQVDLVILCARGRGFVDIVPQLIEDANRAEYRCIRFHTSNPALGRLMGRYGAKLREYVYERPIQPIVGV